MISFPPLSSRLIRPQLHHWRGIKVDKGVHIGLEMIIDSVYPERIGNGCITAHRVQILAHNRDMSSYCKDKRIIDLGYVTKPVIIEDDFVIGVDSTILTGVRIGKGAVVAAGAVVTKDVPEYTMVAGTPARVIKTFK